MSAMYSVRRGEQKALRSSSNRLEDSQIDNPRGSLRAIVYNARTGISDGNFRTTDMY